MRLSANQSLITTSFITLGLLALVVWLDYALGYELSFALFYLLPITFVTWRAGFYYGLSASVLSAVAWFWANGISGYVPSHPAIPYWNAAMRAGFFVSIAYLLARMHELIEKEKILSRMDSLTGLANSRAFYEWVLAEKERLSRYQHAFTLVYMDVDNFKQVNDTLGHAQGDRLLNLIGQGLKKSLRATDRVARLGGDEFVLLLPETQIDAQGGFLHHLCDKLKDIATREGFQVSFSVGAATFHKSGIDTTEMLRITDDLMYQAKHAGKNQIFTSVQA